MKEDQMGLFGSKKDTRPVDETARVGALTPQTRELTRAVDRGILEDDQKLVDELLPTLDEGVRAAYPRS